MYALVSRCVRFLRGWVESQPLQGFLRRFSGAFYDSSEDESRSGIKNRRQVWRSVRSLLPAVRAVTEVFGEFQSGVKIERVITLLRSLSLKAYVHKKKVGVMPRKGAILSKKEKFPIYLTPEKKARLERRYQEDGSRSITGFIERAIDFYLDYLSANDAGLFLPTSIQSYLDGRVGQMENSMASLAYKQAVELDMLSGIIADSFQFSEEDLRRRRAESVRNVKQTNGRISFEKRVRESWEDDDGWQD